MKKILKVPFRKQLLGYSCFPACVNMVLNFYGDKINEKILYKKSLITGHKGTWDVKIGPFLVKKGYDVTTYWNGSLQGWSLSKVIEKAYKKEYYAALKSGLKHKRNANINLIKRLIDKGIPVLTEVNAKKFYNDKNINWTHMLIILGYDDNNFYVHDPDKDYGDKCKKVSINKFKKSWDKLSKFAGRSMFVIKK